MIYAFLIDGLPPEGKERIDSILAGASHDDKSKARRERETIAMLARLPQA